MIRYSIVLAFALLPLATACNRQDKECMTRLCMKTATHAEHGLTEFRKNFGDNWFAGAGLESRVSARLRWDKKLEHAEIIVGMCDEMVELSGTVKTDEQKKHAYDLAVSTLGVKEVVNLLQVAP